MERTPKPSTSPLSVRVGSPTGTSVSSDLWGLFLEDINYALDGGLNADLVRNGGFEFTGSDHPGWGPLTGWGLPDGPGGVEVRSAAPLSMPNATHVRLSAGTRGGRLTNRGYHPEGIWLRPGTYRLRLAARRPEEEGRLVARLAPTAPENQGSGQELVIAGIGDGWSWVELDLTCDWEGRSALELRAATAQVDIDMVELRPLDPDTGAPALFRADLVQALRALRPSFVRFPGGCVAHGYGLDNIYHWKNTIGPREERRPMPNTWGYQQSMAIGYHEYFLLCEELGASPMPVVAAGVCCQNVPGGPQAIPSARMPQYIQDVLDLVEYANGAPDTRWGAVRAAAGHPEPFGLRYLGVGNEDVVSDEFEDRFGQILEAVRAAAPAVTVIGTAGPKPYGPDYDRGWELARRLDVPMVDEHGYRTPRWLLQNLDRYDHYDRRGPAVYLGEWAGRSSTVRSAVAEAAYMVALQRNSDLVQLASYAPLLARVGSTQWLPDLMYFDDRGVLPSCSYHVQQMFAEHRGTEVLACDVEGATARPQPLPSLTTIELRSPRARTHFTEIRTDALVLPDTTVEGEQVATLAAGGSRLELVASRVSGDQGFVVGFGEPGSGTVHEVRVGDWRNQSLVLSRRDDGLTDEIDGPHPFAGVRTDQPIRLRVELDAARITVWVDDVLVHDHVDDVRDWPDFVAGATAVDGTTLVTLVSAADEPRRIDIAIPAAASATAAVTTLAGQAPERGAPFEAFPSPPTPAVAPVRGGVVGVDVPPWSVVTLRVPAQDDVAG